MKKQLALLILTAMLSANASFASSNYSYQQNQTAPYNATAPLKGSVIFVPAGAHVSAITTMPISSETLQLGDNVSVALGSNFYYNNNLIASAGSTVTGTVVAVTKAKHGSINGRLQIKFTQIVTTSGVRIPITGIIKTDDGSGILVGGTKVDTAKNYAKDVAVGTAAGALSGLVFGALAGGDVGRGAALGTAVGAGGGLVKAVVDKGVDVTIPVNAGVDIILTQPVTINPNSYSYDY